MRAVITEDYAANYLQNQSLVGQTIEVNNQKYNIEAVIEKAPANTHIQYELLLSNVRNTVAVIESKWNEFVPVKAIQLSFYDQQYDSESRLGNIFNVFSGIAITISILGLIGLTAFSAEQRLKELGIRKVLRATVQGLVSRFSVEFLKLLGLAFLIAAPLGYFGMNTWLSDYAYSISIGPVIFIISFAASVFIAMITTGYRSYKAASLNPVLSLRDE